MAGRRSIAWAAALLLALPAVAIASPAEQDEIARLGERAVAAVPGNQNRPLIGEAKRLAARFSAQRDAAGEARASQLAGYFSMLAGDNEGSAKLSDRALAICRKSGDMACVTKSAINAAVAHKRAGQMAAALVRLQLAADVAKATGETVRAEQARYNLANVQHAMGDARGALATFEALRRDHPGSETELGSLLTSARIYVELGQARPAVERAREALALVTGGKDTSGWTTDARTTAWSTAGLAYALAGDERRATEYLDRALRRARQSESDEERFDVNARAAWAWTLLDRPARALPFARTAFALRMTVEERDRLDFLERVASLFDGSGDLAAASQAKSEALSITRRMQRSRLTEATASAVSAVGLSERDALVGRLTLQRAEERARLDRLRLLAVAVLASLAVIAAFLFGRLRLGQLRRQQAATLAERTRVARELHDTLIQGFTGLNLQLQQLAREAPAGSDQKQRLETLSRSASSSLAEARNAVWRMRSPLIERGDLRAAIEDWLAAQDRIGSEIATDLAALPPRLDEATTENLLRIVQEAVANALRHAGASQITIAAKAGDGLALTIADDGRGFAADAWPSEHWGLAGMRERAAQLRGSLDIDSAPGRGTRIVVRLPQAASPPIFVGGARSNG